ncbi:MAG: hypothetical protein KKE29_20095 [Proteobacteria bacterium]|nr:hypothetical protein [Pseudomonadota bacterium]MBU4576025.1 hypothetical protein [Pseudomonadota bacterium]MBV1715991.1 hypothetical protein [Desulfarculus sp.]
MNSDLIKVQQEMEAKQAGLGFDRYYKEVDDKKASREESATEYGRRMMGVGIPPLAKRISEFVTKANTGRAGRKHLAATLISQVDPQVVAYLTLKSMLDCVSTTPKIRQIVSRVGRLVELEVRFGRFKEKAKPLFNKVVDQVKKQPHARANTVLVHVANKFDVDPEWEPWTASQKASVGLALVTLTLETLPWFTSHTLRTGKNKSTRVIQATRECLDLIQEVNAQSDLLTPFYLPMVVPPRRWEGPVGGGYLTGIIPERTLVKTHNKEYLEELANRVEDMPEVYRAVNAMQETPWRINQNVLETLKGLWETGGKIAGLPPTDDKPLPEKPEDIETNKDSLRDWKREASLIHAENAKLVSKRLQIAKIIWIGEMFRDFEAIYFPHQLDFRGRAYPMPMFLNPQGMDVSKGCLEFAEGKAIETPEQSRWLAIHGANCWGEDKVSFDDRVKWVVENLQMIHEIADDPLTHLAWTEADKPFQFLAFCFEWSEFVAHGYGYKSRIPVAMDGSNNGLQNFAALLRDEISGKAVNLIPAETPQDIYQVVADKTIEKLKGKATKGDQLAANWLAFGIDRKCTKRPVMVLPYGAKPYSCRRYILDYMRDKIEAKGFNPFGDDLFPAAAYLADIVWDAIGATVVAAREAMDWLVEASRVASKEGLPLTWTTPTGFPVLQAYKAFDLRLVKTVVGDPVYIKIPVARDEINKRKQASGVSPNYVHSLDASHLMKTICLSLDRGVSCFGMVHDSYATHAADAPVLADCLRQAFIDMYGSSDVLADFAREISAVLPDGVELPPLPPKGNLCLDSVAEAGYFFA